MKIGAANKKAWMSTWIQLSCQTLQLSSDPQELQIWFGYQNWMELAQGETWQAFKAGAELVISLRGHMGLLAASEETFG